MRCNNRYDLTNLSFTLKVLVFSEVYLEPSLVSMMKLFAQTAERRYFCKKLQKFTKEAREDLKNVRTISILTARSKSYENFPHKPIVIFNN